MRLSKKAHFPHNHAMDFSSYLYVMCLIICRRLRANVRCPLSYLHLNKGIPLGTCSLPMAMQSTMYVAKLDLLLKKVQLTVFRLVIRTMTSIAWHKKPQQVNQSRHIRVNIHLHRHMEDMKLRFSCRRFEVVAKLKGKRNWKWKEDGRNNGNHSRKRGSKTRLS